MHDARYGQAALLVHGFHTAKAGGRYRRTVIGIFAADDRVSLGLLHQVPVRAHHAHDGVI